MNPLKAEGYPKPSHSKIPPELIHRIASAYQIEACLKLRKAGMIREANKVSFITVTVVPVIIYKGSPLITGQYNGFLNLVEFSYDFFHYPPYLPHLRDIAFHEFAHAIHFEHTEEWSRLAKFLGSKGEQHHTLIPPVYTDMVCPSCNDRNLLTLSQTEEYNNGTVFIHRSCNVRYKKGENGPIALGQFQH